MSENPNPLDGTEKEPVDPNNQPQVDPPAADDTPPPAVDPAPQEPDYKKKFGESSAENQILSSRNKQLQDRIEELTKAPTESELKAAFPSWEFMSDTEKDLARQTLDAKRKADRLELRQQQDDAQRDWNRAIEAAITATPELDGKDDEFKKFASLPTHKGVAMEVLIPAFLHKSGIAPATPTPKKQGLASPTGGPKTPDKPKALTSEELKTLRETNYNAYLDYIKTHDIEI